MHTYEARVYITNGNSQIPHTVRIQADSVFSAQQMFQAQYGSNNVISIPIQIQDMGSGVQSGDSPWMQKYK